MWKCFEIDQSLIDSTRDRVNRENSTKRRKLKLIKDN